MIAVQGSAAVSAPPPEPSLDSLPPPPTPTPGSHPYRRHQPRSKPNNKPIILTAVIGLGFLIVVIGTAATIQYLQSGQTEIAADTTPNKEAVGRLPTTAQGQEPRRVASNKPQPEAETVAHSATIEISSPSSRSSGRKSQSKKIDPPDESGLIRVHLPDGYSMAVPPGFNASPRATHRSSMMYALVWPDGMILTMKLTDDSSLSADSPIPPIYRSSTQDRKRSVYPVASKPDSPFSETFKLNGMNVSFVELEEDVSHKDMTEQLQFMFSGAMTPEMKRQYAHLMNDRVAYRGSYAMKVMDEKRTLECVIFGERDQPFRAPDTWLNYLKTLRRENPPDALLIPKPFLPR